LSRARRGSDTSSDSEEKQILRFAQDDKINLRLKARD
jgi:hypothetical protein